MPAPSLPVVLCDKNSLDIIAETAVPLDLRNVNTQALARVAADYRPDTLRLYHITADSLDKLGNMGHLKRLEMNWITKIADFSPLARLSALEELTIEDAPRLADLGFLAETRVSTLKISGGGAGKPLRLKTVAPLAAMPALQSLTLLNLKIEDDDITCLARASGLTSLAIANMFPMEQFAFLAARLNSRLVEPIPVTVESSIGCETCGAAKVMLTGKGRPLLCPRCDSKKLETFIERFQALVDEYRAG